MRPGSPPEKLDLAGASRAAASPEGRALLADLGLRSLDDLARFEGGEVVVMGGRRTVRRLETDRGPVFLKQSYRGGASLLGDLLRGRGRRSSSRIEAENNLLLDEIGIARPEILVWGERMSGLRELFSFIVARAAPGRDLLEQLLDRPSFVRLEAMSRAVAAVVLRLARAGFLFADLVPRHLFIDDRDGGVEVALIDLHRLRRAAPAVAAAAMLARLEAELPRALVSSGARLRFLRRIEAELGEPLVAELARRRRDLEHKRRNPRRRMERPGAGHADWAAVDGPILARGEGAAILAELGLHREVDAAGLAAAEKRASARGLELLPLGYDDLREVHHGHQYLAGHLNMPEPLARRIDRSPGAFYLRRRPEGRSLVAALRDGADAAALGPVLSQLFLTLLEGEFLPRGEILAQIRLLGPADAVFVPAPTRRGAPDLAALRALIRAELERAGLSPEPIAAFLARIEPVRRGLLGLRLPMTGSD